MRLDAGFRVGPSNDTLTVNYDGAGGVDVVLTHGLYVSYAALYTELNAQLAAVGSITASESAGVTRLAWGSGLNLQITWARPALRDWLGFDAAVDATTEISGGERPGVFVASTPWAQKRPVVWELRTYRGRHPSGLTRSMQAPAWRLFPLEAVLRPAELPAFRRVLRHFAGGTPGTLYRDHTITTTWDFAAWWGTSTVQLDAAEYSDNLERLEGRMGLARVPLTFREVSP